MNPSRMRITVVAVVAIVAVVLGTVLAVSLLRPNASETRTSSESSAEEVRRAGSSAAESVDASDVTWIGDSVSSGLAGEELQKRLPGMVLDARVSKSFRTLDTDIADLESAGKLKDIVVIALGVNGIASLDGMEKTMSELGTRRQVILVYPGGSSGRQTIEVFDTLAAKFPDQVLTADWPAAAPKVTDFAADGIHIGTQGAGVLADTVAPQIRAAAGRLGR